MSVTVQIAQPLSTQLVEIRYKPNSKILDHRGSLADSISNHMGLTEWLITENRVDIFRADKKERGFVAFRNAGFTLIDAETTELFLDRANKFVRFAFAQSPFADPLFVERIGVRAQIAVPFNDSFENLLERYSTRFASLSVEAANVLDASLIDMGFALNFSTRDGRLNVNTGPMGQTQLRQFLDRDEDLSLPDVALYADLDYWSRPGQPMPMKNILNTIKQRALENWQRFERLQNLLVG